MTRIAKPALAGILAITLTGALAALCPSPLAAHSYLIASTPEAASVVASLPAEFSVTANEPLLDLAGDASGFAIQVVDAAGRFYGDGCLTVSGSTLSMGATLGEPGDYRLYWQVVSADGHPISGDLGFAWAPPDAAQVSEGLAAPPVCGEAGPDPTPSATAEPDPEPTAEPTPVATAEPEDGEQNWLMTAVTDPMFIILAVLGLLGAVAVILLAVRALRGIRGKDGDDDQWNAPPSQ